MTDDQIVQIANDVDAFLIKESQSFNINAIDLSAIINSRLRMMSASEGYEDDFDALLDHLNSQTVINPKQIHLIMQKRTYEELAKIVNDYMTKYENTTRNRIKIATGINNRKLDELEQLGLIKLPPRVKAGMNSKTWRWYKT